MMFIILIIIFLSLLGLIVWQGKQVKKNAIRLPEAAGVRENRKNGVLSFLHIGESTVAGVGVDNINQGLSANIIETIKRSNSCELDWQILGVNGATIKDSLTFSADHLTPDILLITFGVNDTTKMTSKQNWVEGIKYCVEKYSDTNTQVFFTSVPPMQKFPLLPFPLRTLLGWRSAFLDRELKKVCRQNKWHHLFVEFGSSGDLMANDGYHPNARGYALWGEEVGGRILKVVETSIQKT